MLHGTVPHPVQCGLAKPEQHHQMLALAGRVRTKVSFGPSEEVSQPGRRRRDGAQVGIGVHFRLLQSAAALRRPPRAVAAAVLARGPVRCGPCGVLVRGLGRQPEIGLNKPANLSARGRGYPVGQCRYQAQTLGASRDRKVAAPRAAFSNSGSLLARRISAFRAPRAPAAPPPPPRRVGTHIPDMRAAAPPPPSPFYHMLGARRFYAVEKPALTPSPVLVIALRHSQI